VVACVASLYLGLRAFTFNYGLQLRFSLVLLYLCFVTLVYLISHQICWEPDGTVAEIPDFSPCPQAGLKTICYALNLPLSLVKILLKGT
jgi:hypothetical protein